MLAIRTNTHFDDEHDQKQTTHNTQTERTITNHLSSGREREGERERGRERVVGLYIPNIMSIMSIILQQEQTNKPTNQQQTNNNNQQIKSNQNGMIVSIR
jgi:hypothetical protein